MVYSSFFMSNFIYAGIALYFFQNFYTKHIFLAGSFPKETFLLLRMVLAGISIFELFPLIYLINKRNTAENSQKWNLYFYSSLGISASVSIYALFLILLTSGQAIRTFFIFLGLGTFYLLIAWPKFPDKISN